MADPVDISPAQGKLGVLTPGMGAVATTLYAGVLAARKGLAEPFGSLTQSGRIRLGRRSDDRNPLIKEFVPLAELDDLVFGGWDAYSDDAYASAMKAGVLEARDIESIGDELRVIEPMPAVFDPAWVRNLPDVDNLKQHRTKMDLAESLMEDIDRFRSEHGVERVSMVWCGSTETYREPTDVHMSLDAFEQGLKDSDDNIAPSQIYAYAALQSDVPF
ncbi:MAG TPA: inositol-3-phosphate synthase, partial [Acidimicrobiia bacterium]|nr:inositol-3-phosphate synthase [Acidimicrobiia bacterium]